MSFKYIAFVLDEQSRQDVKTLFPVKYENEICHHITIVFGDNSPETLEEVNMLLNGANSFMLTGHYNDLLGVECFTAEAMIWNGLTHDLEAVRPNGGKYHLTHSLGSSRKAKESNDVIACSNYKVRGIGLVVTGKIQTFG